MLLRRAPCFTLFPYTTLFRSVVDAELSTTTDPYLDDHVFRGERLLPAVMGMEAMAQVFMALMQTDQPPVFEQVTLDRKSTRLNSSHGYTSYAVFCLKKKNSFS